jgi:LysM repeat protein
MNLHQYPFLSVALSLLFCNSTMAQSADDILPYIQQHQKIAVQQAQNTGIPASILLSQAILESNAGKNHLVLRGNNHFALKCGNDWMGETYNVIADEYDSNGDLTASCFRTYHSNEASYQDFAAFLSHYNQANRFGFLFKLPKNDYQAWAYGIEQSLHPQQKGYSTQLVHLIEDYKLTRFDNLSQEDMRAEEAYLKTGFVHNNRVKLVYAEPNQTLEQIAGKHHIKLAKLLQYNDLEGASTDIPLTVGVPIYLQAKKAYAYDKTLSYHQVKSGENMHQIAQMYGIRLRDLSKRNPSAIGSQLVVDQRVMLRDVDPATPQADANDSETTAEKASKHHSILNNGGFSEHPLPVFTREETDKNNPSGELPAIIPKSYDKTFSAPPAPFHFAAPAQDALPAGTHAPVMIVPENTENHHNFIYTEPTLNRKLVPIKPKKMPAPVSAPTVKKVTVPNVTTYVPIKQQPKGVTKPYYLQDGSQKPVDSYHYVRNGETLFGISRKYGTDVDTLKRLNGKSDNVIVEGQKLRVK